MARALLPLPEDEVHLWYTRPEAATDPVLVAAYERWMTPEEQARAARFLFAPHRHEYLVTRALVRTVLSRYAPVEPGAWRFRTNEYGRPEIDAPAPGLDLRFNLSHTDGLVVCLVARGREVGVDVENVARRGETVAIADRFFAPSEVAALHALPAGAQRERFFAYWTLKEAYIKARGMGLALPLAQFAFVLEPGGAVRISFDPRLPDEPTSWQFARFSPSARHRLAVALRRTGADLRIVLRETVPSVP